MKRDPVRECGLGGGRGGDLHGLAEGRQLARLDGELPAKDAPAGGTLSAFNATTGEGPLWTWQAPGYVNGSGMRYQANEEQFVAVYHQLPSIGQPLYNGHGEQLTAFSL